MELFVVVFALSASLIWALASLVAYKPVQYFGTFEFVRIQLATSALVLVIIMMITGSWDTVLWKHSNALIISGFFRNFAG